MMTLAEFISYLPNTKSFTIGIKINYNFGHTIEYFDSSNDEHLQSHDKDMKRTIVGIDKNKDADFILELR